MVKKLGFNKKYYNFLIIVGIIIIVSLLLVFILIKPKANKKTSNRLFQNRELFTGIPSDAVMVFYFDCLSNYESILKDTNSFAYGLFEKNNPLVKLQKDLTSYNQIENIPFVYSLHYSSKNNVSFLQILDFSDSKEKNDIFNKTKNAPNVKWKDYNNERIYTYSNGLNICFKENLLLASNSSFVLESSIRHFANGTSVLDNSEFSDMIDNIKGNTLLINNKQIGKFFSGEIARDFLGYSDFFHNFSNWSIFDISLSKGLLNLDGYFNDNKSEKNFTNIFYSQQEGKSDALKYVPASTVFATFLNISSLTKYTQIYDLYLDINKKLGKKQQQRSSLRRSGMLTHLNWLDSLQIKEIGVAYCKFGDKSEWISYIKDDVKSKGSFGKLINVVINKKDEIQVNDYLYKGYLASVFGDIFSHCNEEAYCKIGQWNIIGPKNIINEFALGNAYYYSFEDFIKQTPASVFVQKESVLKSIVNLKESPDTIISIFKPYLGELLLNSINIHNFELATALIGNGEDKINIDINFYATNLDKLPTPRIKKEANGEVFIVVDSTINIPKGPFEVYDATRKSKGYFEQLPNNRLRLCGPNMKGIWAIPFEEAISGNVQQIDFFNNGKQQMMFIAGNKLYLLDMLARFVRGYPVELEKKVVLGPFVIDGTKEKEVTIITLNDDNTISRYNLNGKKVKGWKDIKAPEFIRDIPELKEFGNEKYWILKLPSQLKIYNYIGDEVAFTNNKLKIDRESEIEYEGDDEIRVKCTDGKYYIFNLSTFKIKKVR